MLLNLIETLVRTSLPVLLIIMFPFRIIDRFLISSSWFAAIYQSLSMTNGSSLSVGEPISLPIANKKEIGETNKKRITTPDKIL